MAASLDSLATEALNLPKDQRLTLARRILMSLESAPDPDAEKEWNDEIRERIRRHDTGEAKGIPGSQVFAELDRKLKA